MLNPLPDEPALDLQEAARLVFSNWRQELKAALEPILLSGTPETTVQITTDALIVHRVQLTKSALIGSASIEGGKSDIRKLRMLAEQSAPSQDITLHLPSDAALRPHLSLPIAAQDALRRALAYEVERISPIPLEGLYYDYCITNKNKGAVDIELRLVKRTMLDSHIATLQAAGLNAASIEIGEDVRPADWRGFPVDRRARFRVLYKRYRRLGMMGLAGTLMVAAIVGAHWRQSAALDAAIVASTNAGQRAARIEKLQHTITTASKDLDYPTIQKRSPLFVSILADLTNILPDGTWINELSFDGKTIRITGSSTAAADLIEIIGRSSKFHSARFQAPLVHDQANNADRFDLSFQLRGR